MLFEDNLLGCKVGPRLSNDKQKIFGCASGFGHSAYALNSQSAFLNTLTLLVLYQPLTDVGCVEHVFALVLYLEHISSHVTSSNQCYRYTSL